MNITFFSNGPSPVRPSVGKAVGGASVAGPRASDGRLESCHFNRCHSTNSIQPQSNFKLKPLAEHGYSVEILDPAMFQQHPTFQPILAEQFVDPCTASLLDEVLTDQTYQPILPPYPVEHKPVEEAMHVEGREGAVQGGVDERDRTVERERSSSVVARPPRRRRQSGIDLREGYLSPTEMGSGRVQPESDR